jgi:hypothetical protein
MLRPIIDYVCGHPELLLPLPFGGLDVPENVLDLSEDALRHILLRHGPGSTARNASRFLDDVDIVGRMRDLWPTTF